MYDVASSSSQWIQMIFDISWYLEVVLGSLLVVFSALLGLGFAVRHVQKWITGRKA